jgi:hypothetical protein
MLLAAFSQLAKLQHGNITQSFPDFLSLNDYGDYCLTTSSSIFYLKILLTQGQA